MSELNSTSEDTDTCVELPGIKYSDGQIAVPTCATTSAAHKKEPFLTGSCLKKCAGVLCFALVIVAVWIILLMPIVFFHVDLSETLESNQSILVNNSKECEMSSSGGDVACSDDFFFSTTTNSCRPHCDQWTEYPPTTQLISDVVIGISACSGIIITAFILVLACATDRKLFKFPNILIIYQDLTVCVYSVFALIGFTNRERLFCSSPDLLTTFENSATPFCVLAGIASYVAVLPLAIWIITHITVLFWAVKFPISHEIFKRAGRFRIIHALSLFLGLLSPLVPTVVTLASGGFTSLDTRFPPVVCIARNRTIIIYTVALPVIIMIATGITLLILLFRSLIKKYGVFNVKKSRGAELKVLIVFCYYGVVTMAAVLGYTISSQQLPPLNNELMKYFECESRGVCENCNRSGFEQFTNAPLVTIGYSLVALFPVITFAFLIHAKHWIKLKKICHCYKVANL